MRRDAGGPDAADVVEEDRYVVLLRCGHWTQTRDTEAGRWPCPDDPDTHGVSPAADSGGWPAVLVAWECAIEARR